MIGNAGALRHSITLQTRSTTQDDFGGQSTTWSDFATGVRASIEPISGRELLTAQATKSEMTHQFVMRWRPGMSDPAVVAAMRIVWGSRIFNVQSCVNEGERNRWLVVTAFEGLNDG